MTSRHIRMEAPVEPQSCWKAWGLVWMLAAGFGLAVSAAESSVTIRVRGSDTMGPLAQAWAEAYRRANPQVWVDVSASGSGSGIHALIRGATDLADSSRSITSKEMEQARKFTGKRPVEFVVGYDALAIYTHKENPLEEITFAQLAAIYGEHGQITRWSDLGVKHPKLAGKEIVRVSRQSLSGTYEFLRAQVLGNKDFRRGAHEVIGSKQMIDLVAGTPAAIGYAGMGYGSSKVKALKVAAKSGDAPCLPTVENARNKTYPLCRPLRVYTLGEPRGAVKTYLAWLLSQEGQKIVEANGYVSIYVTNLASSAR